MAKNNHIRVMLFGHEVGILGFDPDQRISFFQYHPAFLDAELYTRAFPYIFKRIKPVQVFKEYHGETFRNLPPMIADSLPDMFGNLIFREWLEAQNKAFQSITPLEQLAYVADRGMGALEYVPAKDIPQTEGTIRIDEIVHVLERVLAKKHHSRGRGLNTEALLNIFKIGTSAGGVRPKILIAEDKVSGEIIPGDLVVGDTYHHYLVKLNLPDKLAYSQEKVEYAYYQLAIKAGIRMMPSKLIDDRHFATLRYDRQRGEKVHVLTATGLTGWDFKSPEHSSYENLFRLALDLKVPYADLQELFRRMVFNVIFGNGDDHLKNHSFMYNQTNDSWSLGPAYDLTYPLNVQLNVVELSRALSINNKRTKIHRDDLLAVADTFSIKNPKGIIEDVANASREWDEVAGALGLPRGVIASIGKVISVI